MQILPMPLLSQIIKKKKLAKLDCCKESIQGKDFQADINTALLRA